MADRRDAIDEVKAQPQVLMEAVQWQWRWEDGRDWEMKLNTYTKYKLINDIRVELQAVQRLDNFKASCFGHFMQFDPNASLCSEAIVALLGREVIVQDRSEFERWFRIGRKLLRFSKTEFCLVTGLRFGTSSFDPNDLNLVARSKGGVFSRHYLCLFVVVGDLWSDFIDGRFADHPDDALKVSYVLFVSLYLYGVDVRAYVEKWLWDLVDDPDTFDAFPWGKFAFQRLCHYLETKVQSCSSSGQMNLHGFPMALQLWAYECIPELGAYCGRKVSDGVPRGARWRCPKTTSVDVSFLPRTTGLRIQPTDLEMGMSYMAGIEMDILAGIQYVHHEGPTCSLFPIGPWKRRQAPGEQGTWRLKKHKVAEGRDEVISAGSTPSPDGPTHSDLDVHPQTMRDIRELDEHAQQSTKPPTNSIGETHPAKPSEQGSHHKAQEDTPRDMMKEFQSMVEDATSRAIDRAMERIDHRIQEVIDHCIKKVEDELLRLLPELIRQVQCGQQHSSSETGPSTPQSRQKPADTPDFAYGGQSFDHMTPASPMLSKDQSQPKLENDITTMDSKLSAIPGDDNLVNINGYKIKPTYAPVLEAIFAKHGDIMSHCLCKSTFVRASLLEALCNIVQRLQYHDVEAILSDLEVIENELLDLEASKIEVSWMHDHLAKLRKIASFKEKSLQLRKAKVKSSIVSNAAAKEVKRRQAEIVLAQERINEAENRVNAMRLVARKIDDDISEFESEEYFWKRRLDDLI